MYGIFSLTTPSVQRNVKNWKAVTCFGTRTSPCHHLAWRRAREYLSDIRWSSSASFLRSATSRVKLSSAYHDAMLATCNDSTCHSSRSETKSCQWQALGKATEVRSTAMQGRLTSGIFQHLQGNIAYISPGIEVVGCNEMLSSRPVGKGVAKWAHAPKIFSMSCYFVLWEAVSQTKYCCSLKVKIFAPKNFGLKYLWAWGCRNIAHLLHIWLMQQHLACFSLFGIFWNYTAYLVHLDLATLLHSMVTWCEVFQASLAQ